MGFPRVHAREDVKVEDGYGEMLELFEVEYEVHAGSEGGSDGFVYDPIEVSVIFK